MHILYVTRKYVSILVFKRTMHSYLSICIYTLRDKGVYMYILFYYFDKYTYCLEKMVCAYTNFQQGYAYTILSFFLKKRVCLHTFYKGVPVQIFDRNFLQEFFDRRNYPI
jgi:hypothetical protein